MTPPPSQERIFASAWLHKLQVRYPWAGGYAIAPLTFLAGWSYASTGLTWFSRVRPLLAAPGGLAAPLQASLALYCWSVHFLRRLYEVFFVNDYSGNFQRDSRLEILYYALWGLVAGAAVGSEPLRRHGTTPPLLACCGLGVFAVGEIGNFWCHCELRRLRADKDRLAAGSDQRGRYFIPRHGPFGFVSCPHYSFELLSWVGYAALNAFDATSAFLFISSVIAMAPFAKDRHAKYVELYRNGQREGGDPATRWKMIPGIW